MPKFRIESDSLGQVSVPAGRSFEIEGVPYSVTRYSVLDISPDAKGITLTVIY